MKYSTGIVLIILLFSLTALSQQQITITARPQKIFIEKGENKQVVNLDFLVSNSSKDSFTLTKIMVSVLDKNNKLIHARFLDNNGTAPSIFLIPNRKFNGPSTELIFNPFTDFTATMPLYTLSYEWTFEDSRNQEVKINTSISPQQYEQKQKLSFPLKGKVLVYDAHDLFAHHRRFDYAFAPIKGLGFNSNFMRYGYDFVLLSNSHQQFSGDGKKDEDYAGWAKPVFAIAAGKVIYASNKHKDDHTFDIPALANNPLELYGNCIAIEHADNLVSVYGHLKQNSIKVKLGDTIKPQQEIAAIGTSGSSFFPHLHFEVRTSINHSAEGLPSYFDNVYLLEGANKIKLRSGLVETGNIIEAK